MNAARRAIASGRGDAALQALHAHAQAHADGQMAEDREALRSQALCAAGRNDAAARAATAFLDAHPGSPHRAKVTETQQTAQQDGCGEQ